MSSAGSPIDLDQQIISHAKYRRQMDPNYGGGELDQNKHKRQPPRKVCIANRHMGTTTLHVYYITFSFFSHFFFFRKLFCIPNMLA